MENTVDLAKIYGTKGGALKCIYNGCPFDGWDMPKDWRRPAVIVVPGGAYQFVSAREGVPVANAFLARGFQCFVLNYSVESDGARYPEQLAELACAADYIKKHADDYYVNPSELFVVGFSAGGHLAADLAVEWKNVGKITGIEVDCKPTAVGLGYPVISAETAYMQSHKNLLSGYTEEEQRGLLKRLNLDAAVDSDTAPAFIWTTASDEAVPSENSLLFALALARCGVPYELHVYPDGRHGGSTCDREINRGSGDYLRAARWLDDCAAFFRKFTAESF